MDKLATELRRGDRVWIGGAGWYSITRVRHLREVQWIGEAPGPAVELRWRHQGVTVSQHVKPDAMIAVEGRA